MTLVNDGFAAPDLERLDNDRIEVVIDGRRRVVLSAGARTAKSSIESSRPDSSLSIWHSVGQSKRVRAQMTDVGGILDYSYR